jgi:DUF4097 and DUF4098 domain-containing protein YvlB
MVAVLIAALVLAQDVKIVEERPSYWLRTSTGSFPAPSTGTIRVLTRGHVVLRGVAGDQIAYTLNERVRAHSSDEAQRAFGKVVVRALRRGGSTMFTLLPMAPESVAVEWELTVPRRATGVVLDTQIGDVEAYDLDGSLHVDTAVGLIHCDRIQGGVEANTGGGEIRLGKIGGPARCISAAGSIIVENAARETICRTAGGEIQIREAGGPLTLATEGGNIEVDKAASSVEAHTAEGTIQIAQAAGAVLADTRGGAIEVGAARGANCQSAAGMIRVKAASGPLKIQTAVGSILAELLTGANLDNSSLLAGSGDITVMIPWNLALSVVARNDSGGSPRILTDFSELRARKASLNQPVVYEGAINGGGPVLTLDTAAGVIYVRKSK